MSKKIYVGNLSYQATEDQVRGLFEAYGDVESIAMINDRDSGRFRGFCFVEMGDGADAAIAALDGQEVDGRNLKVNEARPREERGGGNRGGGGYRGGGGGNRGGGNRGGGNRGGGSGGGRSDYPDSGGNRRW